MEYLYLLIVLAFIGFILFAAFTKKGKGIFFGGELVKTIDREVASSRGIINANIKVHVVKTDLQYPNDLQVGLEFRHTLLASFKMTPITLNKQETDVLISMLREAIEYQELSLRQER